MADRVTSGLQLPRLGPWPRASERVAAVGLDLAVRGHCELLAELGVF